MLDPRIKELAKRLIGNSVRLKKGEKILIEAINIPSEMVISLIREAVASGGAPFVTLKDNEITRAYLSEGKSSMVDRRTKIAGDYELYRMKKMNAYIGLRGSYNICETSDVSSEKMNLYNKNWFKPVHLEQRVKHTKWVVLRWPTPSMAQQAGMSTEAFEDFYFDVCLVNYLKMEKAAKPLVQLFNKTNNVCIKGPGTDLAFSIKGQKAMPCCGQMNIPDGEIFTSPIKTSVNGRITFNAKTINRGIIFEKIYLEFKNGKVVKSDASNKAELDKILNMDAGARHIGEFALGINPLITKPMCDILFDEKIRGSLHLALGQAYEDADNGNRSSLHWDLVLLQEKAHGGGEIYFDGKLVRKDGKFILPALKKLNPERLLKK